MPNVATNEVPQVQPVEPVSPPGRFWATVRKLAPGLALCLGATALAMLLNQVLPAVSPLIIAIVAGIALTNLIHLPAGLQPGIQFSAKKLLRWGIVFLGLTLVLSDIWGLGAPMLLVVVAVVGGGILGTILLGRVLGIHRKLSLLIGCGFSICGAAAVAGVEGVVDAEEEDVVTAVALVVIFGTLMIPLIPALGHLLGMPPEVNGLWAGASIHEIAQAVAAGEAIGHGALELAVITKLSRVLMLAPVVLILALSMRRAGNSNPDAKRPPLVPLFIIGFLAMVLLRSFVDLPEGVLAVGGFLQTALLSAAMFGLGCGVKIRELVRVGARPFVLAALSTVLVMTISGVGIFLTQL